MIRVANKYLQYSDDNKQQIRFNMQKADGLAYKDSQYGVWSGTFVDNTHSAAINKCLQLAKSLAEGPLPEDGTIVVVSLEVNQRQTEILKADIEAALASDGEATERDVDEIADDIPEDDIDHMYQKAYGFGSPQRPRR